MRGRWFVLLGQAGLFAACNAVTGADDLRIASDRSAQGQGDSDAASPVASSSSGGPGAQSAQSSDPSDGGSGQPGEAGEAGASGAGGSPGVDGGSGAVLALTFDTSNSCGVWMGTTFFRLSGRTGGACSVCSAGTGSQITVSFPAPRSAVYGVDAWIKRELGSFLPQTVKFTLATGGRSSSTTFGVGADWENASGARVSANAGDAVSFSYTIGPGTSSDCLEIDDVVVTAY